MAGTLKHVIAYICLCGCRVPHGQLIKYRDRRDGKDGLRMVCPEHYLDGAYITGYVLKRADCGKEFEDERRKERCPECHEKNYKAVLKRNMIKYKATKKGQKATKKATETFKAKKPKKESLEDPSRIHCARRNECLDKYKNQPYVKYLPCKGCNDYGLQHEDADPVFTKRDF